MRLHLASLDLPDKELGYVPDWIEIENRKFEVERIVVDNHQFARCSFVRCTLIFAGGPFGFYECEIDGDTVLALTGAGLRGYVLGKALAERPDRFFPG